MNNKDKNFIATYNGESFDFTFASGSIQNVNEVLYLL